MNLEIRADLDALRIWGTVMDLTMDGKSLQLKSVKHILLTMSIHLLMVLRTGQMIALGSH